MKIAHIADLHIQASRKQEYIGVIDNMLDALEVDKPDIMVIAGDVFDNKVSVRPDEIDVFYYLVKCLIDLQINVIIIPGNHDCNMNDSTATDLLQPIIKEGLQDNDKYASRIWFWNKTNVYQALGFDWYVYSPIDRLKPVWKSCTSKRIALVHETIKSCMLQNGEQWNEDTRLTVQELAAYDMVLIGDVHKMQWLKPHMAYSGSLVQQNIGESHLGHGYIMWDTATCRGVHHEVVNPTGVMLKMQFHSNKALDTYMDVKVAKRVDVFHKQCTQEYIAKIHTWVRERWGVNVTRFRETTPHAAITDVEESSNMLDAWLRERGTTVEQARRIKQCDTRYNRDAAVSGSRTFSLVYMEWNNMLCYANDEVNWIDFTEFRNSDRVGIMGANRSGKSSILDILSYLLYNVPLRGGMRDILNKNSTRFNCRLQFSCNGLYEISKSGDAHDHTKLHVTCNGDVCTKSTIPKTYEWLQTIVGRHSDFVNITCQLQDQSMFTSLSAREQVGYLYNVLGLDKIPDLIKSVRQDRLVARASERQLVRPAAAPTADPQHPVLSAQETVDLQRAIGVILPQPAHVVSTDRESLLDLQLQADRLRNFTLVESATTLPVCDCMPVCVSELEALRRASNPHHSHDAVALVRSLWPVRPAAHAVLCHLPQDTLQQLDIEISRCTTAVLHYTAGCTSCEANSTLSNALHQQQLVARRHSLAYTEYQAALHHNSAIETHIQEAALHTAWQQRHSADEARLKLLELSVQGSHVNGQHRWMLQQRIQNLCASQLYSRWQLQQQQLQQLQCSQQQQLWQQHQVYNLRLQQLLAEQADLDLYLEALNMETGYPAKLIAYSIDKLKKIMQDTVAMVTTDVVDIARDFSITVNTIPVQLSSGFQKMIVNLALRTGMLQLAQVAHQKTTLFLDECITGSCDAHHMQQVIKNLLPNLPVRLFLISHNNELKAAMTKVIQCTGCVKSGKQL